MSVPFPRTVHPLFEGSEPPIVETGIANYACLHTVALSG